MRERLSKLTTPSHGQGCPTFGSNNSAITKDCAGDSDVHVYLDWHGQVRDRFVHRDALARGRLRGSDWGGASLPLRDQGWIPFLLTGLGFYGEIELILTLPAYRPWLYAAGIPNTLAQMVGWYVVEQPAGPGDVSGQAAFDKLVQLLLIVLLFMLYRAR